MSYAIYELSFFGKNMNNAFETGKRYHISSENTLNSAVLKVSFRPFFM